ncbi:hypothetical protein SANTM175S_07981 [Streptomyces antimycoticus]
MAGQEFPYCWISGSYEDGTEPFASPTALPPAPPMRSAATI